MESMFRCLNDNRRHLILRILRQPPQRIRRISQSQLPPDRIRLKQNLPRRRFLQPPRSPQSTQENSHSLHKKKSTSWILLRHELFGWEVAKMSHRGTRFLGFFDAY